MNRDQGMTLAYARDLAEALVELLRPACQRIKIAGSVRRGKARPNDIEIVAIPRFTLPGQQLSMTAPLQSVTLRSLPEQQSKGSSPAW